MEKLEDVVANIRYLAPLVRDGWNNKKIFTNKRKHGVKIGVDSPVNDGWEVILLWLDNCLIGRGILTAGTAGLIPRSVHKLLVEAESILSLIGPTVDTGTLRGEVAEIVRNNTDSHEAANDIIGLLQEKYKLF